MTTIELYSSADGSVSLEVRAEDDTVWLSRQQIAALFARDVKTVGKHIANARREELADIPTVAKFATVQREGDREVQRQVEHYSLDMVLSVGYRVKSAEGVHFRRWANDVLKRYITEGAALNEQRLEQLASSGWDSRTAVRSAGTPRAGRGRWAGSATRRMQGTTATRLRGSSHACPRARCRARHPRRP